MRITAERIREVVGDGFLVPEMDDGSFRIYRAERDAKDVEELEERRKRAQELMSFLKPYFPDASFRTEQSGDTYYVYLIPQPDDLPEQELLEFERELQNDFTRINDVVERQEKHERRN